MIDSFLLIWIFSIFIIPIVLSVISFSIAEDDTKAAPNPKLTAVLIPSIEFNCKIVFNCLVSIWFWIKILSINFFIVELEFNVIKSKQYKSSLLIFFFLQKDAILK